LIYLSVQHHAAQARQAAAAIVAGYVGRIDPEIQKLGNLVTRQAFAASRRLLGDETLESIPLAENTFWMSTDDRVIASLP
ncbi:hypothetical protein ABTE07_21155, partial [Acinetobacter baumannii]